MKKLHAILSILFADKYLLVTNGKKGQHIETTYAPNEIAISGNALYFDTKSKV